MAKDNLLKHEHLSKNTFWNILSQLLPAAAAFFVIPTMLRVMGPERFGLLTICWMISGYFSLLDFGIGRALTQKIAGKIVLSDEGQISSIIKNALVSTLVISIFLSLLLAALTHTLIITVLQVPESLLFETKISFVILAVSLPLVIGGASLRGILESIQRFDLVNIVRVPTSTLSFLSALFILNFSNELHWVLAGVIFFRVITFFFYWRFCAQLFPSIRNWSSYRKGMNLGHIVSLLKVGGWMTVSNVISPVMAQMDRFFIGHIMTISVVAYYTTPYEMVSKLQIFIGAVAGVLFPALSTSLSSQTKNETRSLLDKGTVSVVALVLPAALFLILFAPEILTLWLNKQLPPTSVLVFQILTIGFFYNAVANIPFALIQAGDRSDITAKIHIFELFIYIPIIIWLTKSYGLVGVAAAWSIRSIVDTLLLSYFEARLLETSRINQTLLIVATATMVFIGFIFLSLNLGLWLKITLELLLITLTFLIFVKLTRENKFLLFTKFFKQRTRS